MMQGAHWGRRAVQLERTTPAGLRFLQLYPADSMPYGAIIDPRTGSGHGAAPWVCPAAW